MSDETRTISISLRRMPQEKLDSFLEAAADIPRGNVVHSEFRGYVFALNFSNKFISPARKMWFWRFARQWAGRTFP